jgi:LysM repeat protein
MRRILVPAVAFFLGLGVGLLVFLFSNRKSIAPVQDNRVIVISSPVDPKPCVATKHTVVKGDNLWSIAERAWGGRGYFWPVLAEANNVPNPNLILVGQMLVIPCLCDLPVLAKKPMPVNKIKKVVPKKAKLATPKVVCPACPPTELKTAVPAPAAQPETPTEAPKPSLVQTPIQPTPAPAPQPVAQLPAPASPVVTQPAPKPQPVPPPAKSPEEEIIPPEHQSYHESGPVNKQPTTPKKISEVPVTKGEHWGHGDDVERATPGSLWDIVGTSPLEKNNWVDYFHVDQGILLGKIGKIQVVPYVGFNAVKDSKGFPWNNRVQGEAGIKFARPFLGGVIDVGTAFAAERRFGKSLLTNTKTGLIGFAGGWHGWQQPNSAPSSRKFLPGTLPGTFQWRVGNISPFERNNVIGSLRTDQGFTLAKLGRVYFIPTGTFQGWVDSDKNPWNRRYMYGGGLKIAVPFKSSVVDVQGGYMCARQYSGAPSVSGTGCGPAVSLNIWTGWGRGKK